MIMEKYKSDGLLPELKEGQNHFCVRYEGFGKKRTVVAAKSSSEARGWFEKHYPMADIISVRKGQY